MPQASLFNFRSLRPGLRRDWCCRLERLPRVECRGGWPLLRPSLAAVWGSGQPDNE